MSATPEDPLRAAAQAVVDALPYEPGSILGGKLALLHAALAAPPVEVGEGPCAYCGAQAADCLTVPADAATCCPDCLVNNNGHRAALRSAAPALDVERLRDVLADWTIPELDRLVEPEAARHYAAAIAREYAALAPLHPEADTASESGAEVGAAWFALSRDLPSNPDPAGEHMTDIVARHRPIIEAALRSAAPPVAGAEELECGICGDYTANGIEVHEHCLRSAAPALDVERLAKAIWTALYPDPAARTASDQAADIAREYAALEGARRGK